MLPIHRQIEPLFPSLLLRLNYDPPLDLIDYVDHYYEQHKYRGTQRSNRLGWQSHPHTIDQLHPILQFIDLNTYTTPLTHNEQWININPLHGYNITHTHPNSDYTFVYYLTDDNVSINLVHPHLHEQHNHYISLLPEYKQQYPSGHRVSITPNKGDILMFPSYIPHYVTSNNKSTRISLSWNSNVKGVSR